MTGHVLGGSLGGPWNRTRQRCCRKRKAGRKMTGVSKETRGDWQSGIVPVLDVTHRRARKKKKRGQLDEGGLDRPNAFGSKTGVIADWRLRRKTTRSQREVWATSGCVAVKGAAPAKGAACHCPSGGWEGVATGTVWGSKQAIGEGRIELRNWGYLSRRADQKNRERNGGRRTKKNWAAASPPHRKKERATSKVGGVVTMRAAGRGRCRVRLRREGESRFGALGELWGGVPAWRGCQNTPRRKTPPTR